jgi:glycosyltransferase involved in cell wall biosynthesis
MKVVMIHNRYKYHGGEDAVFQAESAMLTRYGHSVEELVFDNKEIQSTWDKILLVVRGIYNSKSAAELEKVILRFKPDIIHVHNFFPLASPSIFFAAKRYGIPLVITLHNYRLICPSATLYFNGRIYEENIHKLFPLNAIVNGVYRNSKLQTAGLALITTVHNLIGTWRNKVSKFIVLTNFAKGKFIDSALRVRENQFIVKPNFVEDPGYSNNEREDFFLVVGRLSEEKGIATILEAIEHGSFKVIFIGDGPLKDRVLEATARNANIQYLGFQNKSVILEYLRRCKALLFPSVWYEGFPITILEAFSTGTPIVASRLGSMAEVVTDQVNGLHFEVGSAQDLTTKVHLLNGNANLVARLGANARKTYEDLYTPEKNSKLLLDIYNQLLTSPKQPVTETEEYGK